MEADLRLLEGQLDSLRKERDSIRTNLENELVIRKNLASELVGNQPPRTAPAQEPAGDETASTVKPASAAGAPLSKSESKATEANVNDERPVPYVQGNKIVIVASPDGHVVTGYSSETGESKAIRLAEKGDPHLQVNPVLNSVMAVLAIRGTKINRVAAFNSIDGSWYPQDLVEPATSAAPGVGSTAMALYTIGNRVYAFSGMAGRWGVLELPNGGKPKPAMGLETISCQVGDHLHVFSIRTGKWTDIDTRTVPDDPKLEQARAERSTQAAPAQTLQAAKDQRPAEKQAAEGPKQPEYLDPNQPIIIPSPNGDVVTIFGVPNRNRGGMGGMGGMGMMGGGMGGMMSGGRSQSYTEPQSVRLADEGAPRLEVTAITNQFLIPLRLRGEKIQRLAVFNKQASRWDVAELREPVKEATPVSSNMMTVYALGRRLYTYSGQAGRWSVLELPEGATPEGVANDRGLTLKYGDKVHIYNIQSGEWTEFDLRTTPKEPEKEE
jgi:hypothetical protein